MQRVKPVVEYTVDTPQKHLQGILYRLISKQSRPYLKATSFMARSHPKSAMSKFRRCRQTVNNLRRSRQKINMQVLEQPHQKNWTSVITTFVIRSSVTRIRQKNLCNSNSFDKNLCEKNLCELNPREKNLPVHGDLWAQKKAGCLRWQTNINSFVFVHLVRWCRNGANSAGG